MTRRKLNARLKMTEGGSLPEEQKSRADEGNRSIVVTTFEKRQFYFCIPLVKAIRDSGCEYPITIVVNGNLRRDHDRNDRSKFLAEIARFNNIEIVTLNFMGGMSHNWNLGIRLANTESTLVLSDDIIVDASSFNFEIRAAFEFGELNGFCLINKSFAHFIYTEKIRTAVGSFDERFIGFGEEDGDFMFRYETVFGSEVPNITMRSLVHTIDQMRGDDETKIDKYSLANYVYLRKKYTFGRGTVKHAFGDFAEQRISDIDVDPLRQVRNVAASILLESDEDAVNQWFDSLAKDGNMLPVTRHDPKD